MALRASKVTKETLRSFKLEEGLPDINSLQSEINDMLDVLMGRVPPPITTGVTTLMEVADAFYARLTEIAILIKRKEDSGSIKRGSAYYKFRTGELRLMMDMVSKTTQLGSRRLSAAQLKYDKERSGMESR